MKLSIEISVFKFTGLYLFALASLATSVAGFQEARASLPESKELARVNDKSITVKDLTLLVSSLSEAQKNALLKDPASRKQLVQDLVDREVLAAEGEKLKLDQDMEFKEHMANYRKQSLVARVLEKKIAPQINQKAAKQFYELHKDIYSTERVRVQHILLSDETEARKVFQLAQDSKNDFQELAEKYSKDPNVKNNRGDLGYIGHDLVTPNFVEAAFATGEGKVGGPVHTSFGYHVFKVIDKKFGKPLEFYEVEPQVNTALKQQIVKIYTENVRTQNKVKFDDAAIESANF